MRVETVVVNYPIPTTPPPPRPPQPRNGRVAVHPPRPKTSVKLDTRG